MSKIVDKLSKDCPQFCPPKWLPQNVVYETIMGSQAYGITSENSDTDVYGIVMPTLDNIFPHTIGEIPGFGRQKQRFESYQQHHLLDENQKEYDVSVFSIVKFFALAMENNPNIIDALFVPRNCITYTTHIGEVIRENRHTFIHKGCFHKYKGYSFSQRSKIASKNPDIGSKRKELVEKFGFDTKFAYHAVRLLCQCEQILRHGDLDLQQNNEMYKAIRRGDWKLDDVLSWIAEKEKSLEILYDASNAVPYQPDEDRIKELLIRCIEMHYGSVSAVLVRKDNTESVVSEIQKVLEKYGYTS